MTINITELVHTFQAEEAEKLERADAVKNRQSQEALAVERSCIEQATNLRKSFYELLTMLPTATRMGDIEFTSVVTTASFTVGFGWGGEAVEMKIGVRQFADPNPRYLYMSGSISPHSTDNALECNVMDPEHIITLWAAFVGKARAKDQCEKNYKLTNAYGR